MPDQRDDTDALIHRWMASVLGHEPTQQAVVQGTHIIEDAVKVVIARHQESAQTASSPETTPNRKARTPPTT
jgi:hypothetical protein